MLHVRSLCTICCMVVFSAANHFPKTTSVLTEVYQGGMTVNSPVKGTGSRDRFQIFWQKWIVLSRFKLESLLDFDFVKMLLSWDIVIAIFCVVNANTYWRNNIWWRINCNLLSKVIWKMLMACLRATSFGFSYTSIGFCKQTSLAGDGLNMLWPILNYTFECNFFSTTMAAQQTEWGTLIQPLEKPTADGNKYSSAAKKLTYNCFNMFSPKPHCKCWFSKDRIYGTG